MKLLHHVHKHCHRHINDTIHALTHHIDTIEHSLLVVAIAIGFTTNSLLAGTSVALPKETVELIYPLKQVSTLPCRQQMKARSELDASCKVDLPIIKGANYDYYRDTDAYKDTPFKTIYSVLWGASYEWQRDMEKWDHAGVDISTAKGTPLYAVAHGIVTFAWQEVGYGNVVKIMFRYQWTTYHAVYGHMDEISVSKWDTVTQSQQIGTVGNSWDTFGALWWYHVHFEIDRDNAGRPMFYYDKCPALVTEKKSFTEITNNGLCREYREKAQLDPIAFIEKSKWKTVASLATTIPTITKDTTLHPSASDAGTSSAKALPQFMELKKLDPTKLSKDALLFVRDRDIQLVATYSPKMKIGEEATLQLFVTKKGTAAAFQWPLPAGFTLISPTNGVTPSIKSINYLTNGMQTLTFTPAKKWTQKLAISLWGQTVGVIELSVSAK